MVGLSALAVREAGGQEVEELGCDGPAEAVPGGARWDVFAGAPRGWLATVMVTSQHTPHTHTDSHLPVFFELTGLGGPIPSV